MKTALYTAARMPLPPYAHDAMRYDRHPQDRTHAFHMFYDAPIHRGRLTRTFEHMDDQRVAFRAAFILGEAIELIEKGLGVKVGVNFQSKGHDTEDNWKTWTHLTDDADMAQCLHSALAWGGKRDLVEVVDALGDLNVVVNGFAIELGVDMRRVDQEVCASNFTKPDENGKPIIGDGVTGPVGKVMKGPNYRKPQLAITLGLEKE